MASAGTRMPRTQGVRADSYSVAAMAHPTAPPIALLLVPRTVERFILYDQGQDLLRAPGVVGVDAPRVPYGALGRLPDWLGDTLASAQARRLRLDGEPVVAMMF